MLEKLFTPRSIALIGASTTPGKLGFDILMNLVDHFKGKVYPINPKAETILGEKAYPDIASVPGEVDMAVIAIPAEFVGKVVDECGKKGIRNLVIITAGFKEIGGEGLTRENEIKELIEKYGLNVVGPNCLGILNPHVNLNASFAEGMPAKGKIALISQSGAMAVAIADWASGENIGFSKIISLGNKAGVNENTCLEYFCHDEETEVIMMYLESFIDGRKFMETAKKISMKKPIIVFKSGISEAGSSAVASHTGALAGSDTAVATAMRQSGVIRAKTIEDFFDYARVFSMQRLPKGPDVAVVTNAGGPGVIATDAIDRSPHLRMAKFSPDTTAKLKESLPPTANIHNPVDIIGDALADRYRSAFESVLADEEVDMLLAILTPQIMTEKESTVRSLSHFHEKYPDTPILAAFMGGKNIKYAAEKLAENDIPNFIYPERAVKSLEAMEILKKWRMAQKSIEKGKRLTSPLKSLRSAIAGVAESGAKNLSPDMVVKLLKHYDISVAEVKLSQSADEAAKDADAIGYPVVMKIISDDVLHKTDAGGVRLGVKNREETKKAYDDILCNVLQKFPEASIKGVLVQKMYSLGREVIIGMKRDPAFGPLIMFGLGGIYVEAMKDVAFRVAPFSREESLEMIDEVKAIKILKGVRGEAPSDITTLADTVMKVGEMAMDIPEISELDINPLMVFSAGKGVVALDARVIL